MLARESENSLQITPLHALHLQRGGKMVPFAGYDMPVQFAAGVLKEHLHTRKSAGLFDVSHMGQLVLRAKSGRVEDAARCSRHCRGRYACRRRARIFARWWRADRAASRRR